MENEINARPMNEGDLQRLAEIYVKIDERRVYRENWTLEQAKKAILAMGKPDTGRSIEKFVAENEGKIVGGIFAYITNHPFRGRILMGEELIIDPDLQRGEVEHVLYDKVFRDPSLRRRSYVHY